MSCNNKNETPIISKRNKDIICFIKRFGSNLRAILTNEKDDYFLALFLDNHKYYENEMKNLGF